MPTRTPLRALSIHLASLGLASPESVLRDSPSLQRLPLLARLPFRGALYVKPTRDRTPPWVEFLRPGVGAFGALRTRSQSAVLLLQASRRTFALTFGHGSAMLLPGALEPDFGIKTVLNSVEPGSIRSVDAHTFEELPRVARVQTSRAAWLDSFGFDVERDVLQAVTGQPEDETLCHRLTGRDATLAVQARLELEGLGQLCSRLLRQYRQTAYKNRFPWFDHLRRVRDPQRVAELDQRLVRELTRGAGTVRAVPPEIQDMLALRGYSASLLRKELFPEIPLSEYLAARSAKGGVTLEALRHDEFVALRAEDGLPAHRWSVYQCLQMEVRDGAPIYVLSGGNWFAVASAFSERIRSEVAQLPEVAVGLPDARPGEHEGAYNLRAAESGQRAVLDQKLVRCNGPRTEIEVCDVLTRRRQFVHVKRRGASGVLSHLFAQGRNAAQVFLEEPDFRAGVRARLRDIDPRLERLIPTTRPDSGQFQVVFAIIDSQDRPVASSLPFLSQITLAQTARHLRGVGYKVALTRIGTSAARLSAATGAKHTRRRGSTA